MSIEIVFETHSTTEDNEAGRATGWLPGRLSQQGKAQARELGRRRAQGGIAAVFCSDLRRAVQTAELAFDGRGGGSWSSGTSRPGGRWITPFAASRSRS